ncbi:hypothetical protein [Streptomyces sp. SID13031]|uniref:hypothetical protein n=1 Tax=Streptomyces sp. SID13031 TaxID=2706046 RepID=UPI0013C57A06|nr:hypothetical protein [Streptomyces sp. SID13031]NEA37437.1 hypothetical protein [Streptomyces sp. SID13031]
MARPEPCVLELVSKLAREPWTDRPTCVHPVLGSIARMVHDHSTKAGRRALLPLAPDFLQTARPGFEGSARLVALCVSTALATEGELTGQERVRLSNAHQTAMYLLDAEEDPGGTARWWLPVLDRVGLSESFYRTFVATEHAAEAVAITARAADDIQLRRLLKQCLSIQGARRPGAPSPSWSAAPVAHKLWS